MWRKVFSTQKDHHVQISITEREQGTNPESLLVMSRSWTKGLERMPGTICKKHCQILKACDTLSTVQGRANELKGYRTEGLFYAKC